MGLSGKTVLSVTASLLLLALVFTAASGQGNPPKFMVKDKTVDLGTFYEGKDIEYQFTIRNTGSSELQILGVRPG